MLLATLAILAALLSFTAIAADHPTSLPQIQSPDLLRSYALEIAAYGGIAAVKIGKDGAWVAGSMQNTPEMQAPDCWNVYLAVDDAEASIASCVTWNVER